ncbi:hypothetical protein R1flu_000813 [Riccia fluitans]|uniref:Uncharacterized protein n=1 Tax=Riccia fluitans TaxID=41844 RepID=A0ABD1Y1H0_9MARC
MRPYRNKACRPIDRYRDHIDRFPKGRLAAEVERIQQRIRGLIKEANISLSLQELTVLSPVCKEFVVSQLAEKGRVAVFDSIRSGAYKGPRSTPEDLPVGLQIVRACCTPPMIPIRIGEVNFPRGPGGYRIWSQRDQKSDPYQARLPPDGTTNNEACHGRQHVGLAGGRIVIGPRGRGRRPIDHFLSSYRDG